MAKKKTLNQYINDLRDRIEKRVGVVEDFLVPQIEETARLQMLLGKFYEQLMTEDLTTIEVGSMGQSKTVINPLLAQYDKMHRTLTANLTALGLNYNTTPSKVIESTDKGNAGKDDPMARMYQQAKDAMDNL